ncbi:MAG: response regulator transcription factor [Lachnospiraceae bacterium]|nr:response regulator transcription factor [Lachnospiraceae bacterium]
MRLLIVDDEKEIADGIQAILKQEGYETDAVYEGEDGLDHILSGIYDLILLDVMLPGIDGFEILKQIRKENVKTPVIMLTARSVIQDKITGLDLGADDYLTKPFDSGELLARIRARLRADNATGQSEDVNKIKAYDITLDRSTYRLSHGDKSVKLSNKEYQLIEYLMINKGMILSRDAIADKIWGIDDDADYNSVVVYISFLRKKLKFISAEAAITTKKDVGYSLEINDGKSTT